MNCSGPGGSAYKIKLCPILGSLKPSKIPIPIVKLNLPKMHKIVNQSLESPVGSISIQTCDQGVHRIRIDKSAQPPPEEQSDLKDLDPSGIAHRTLTWLQHYFEPKPEVMEEIKNPENYPPICWEGLGKAQFGEHVLKILKDKVKFGETVPYAELAKLVGKPTASRAIGNALKDNPVLIIIPCHRIVRSDGSIGNYAGGAEAKKWLIEFEEQNI